ncbi:MAG: SDR family oxidoreductase [Acidobacteriaceae bacterium]
MADKQIALVTGGNKGIGYETCRQLAEKDYYVLLGARDVDKGREAARTIAASKGEVHPLQLDVTDAAQRAAAAKHIEQTFGRLDVLVNNAGVMSKRDGAADKVPEEVMRETLETNLFAVISLTQLLLPLLHKSAAGRIVNVSSILGSLSYQSKQTGGAYDVTAYNTSKAALNMYTIHLARALRRSNIKVNAVHPGWVQTDLGGANAPLDTVTGAKTSVAFATLGADGPTGTYVHQGETLAW